MQIGEFDKVYEWSMLTSWFNLIGPSPEVSAAYICYSSIVNRVMQSNQRDRIGGETIIGMSVIVK